MPLSNPTSLALASSQTSGGVASIATGSVSPPSDCLLIAAGIEDSGAGTTVAMSTTLANVGAWTVVQSANYGTNDAAWIATAKVTGAPGSGTVTATFGVNLVDNTVMRLYYVTGHDTVTPIKQSKTSTGTAATATVTLDTQPAALSEVFALCGQVHFATSGSKTMVPSGTELNQDYLNNTSFSFDIEAEYQYTNGLAPTTHTVGTLGTPDAWGMVAIEINAAAIPFHVKEVGFVTNTTGATTSAITVAAGGVAVGDTIVIYGAADNSGVSGVATTIAAADNHAGTTNVYTLQTPQAIADPIGSAAGSQGFFLVCPVTTALSAGDVITITYGDSTVAKAINAQQFRNVNTTTPVLAGTYARDDNETGQVVSLAATPTKAGQIVCTLVSVEGGTADAFTQDADTTNGVWVTITRRGSGSTTGGITNNSTYKSVSASGAQSYGTATMLGTARDHCGAILVLDTPSTGQTAAFGVATETDTAGAWGKKKSKAWTAPSEADSAGTWGRKHARAWGAATETDTAGQWSMSLGWNAASETDSAGTWGRRKTKAWTAPTETDSAGTWGRIHKRAWTAPSETDTAGQWAIKLGWNPALETDSAGAWSRAKRKAWTAPTETDTAGTWARIKTRAWGVASETDTSGAWGHGTSATWGAPSETDGAGAWGRRKARAWTAPTETDSAGTWARRKVKAWTAPAETDTAGQWAMRLGWNPAIEADSAGAWTHGNIKAWGPGVETDSAGAWVKRKASAWGAASEIDSAGALGRLHVRAWGPGVETDTAGPWTRAKVKAWTAPIEVDTAGQWALVLGWAAPSETDTAGTWIAVGGVVVVFTGRRRTMRVDGIRTTGRDDDRRTTWRADGARVTEVVT